MATGNNVREAINQGFTRAELGSLADKKATQVYSGAHADGKVVADRCTNAIENYRAAVACFIRSLPSLADERSAELVRAEIRRLLARLGELEDILKQTDPTNPLLEQEEEVSAQQPSSNDTQPQDDGGNNKQALKNRLLADLKFQIGDEVQVDDDAKLGRIASVDLENGTYGIIYDDGKSEAAVIEDRVRARSIMPNGPVPELSAFEDLNDYERFKIWSELVESERIYRDALKQLVQYYLIPLDNPMQWGGTRSKGETVFTQKSITQAERLEIFGNIEDLAGTSAVLCETLESKFNEWKADQKLADVFLQFGSLFEGGYPLYAETYYSSIGLLKKIQTERSAFEAIFERARLYGAPPLETLMELPLKRPAECKKLLQSLARRTKEKHPDMISIRNAFVMMGRVEEAMRLALDRVQMEAKLAEIEQQFSPPIKIVKKGRYFVRFEGNLKRIEGSTITPRCVWLFNDLIILGRKSEWFNKGSFRHIGQFFITKVRAAPEYGPLAFEVAGKSDNYVFVAFDEKEKEDWLKSLRGFIAPKKVTTSTSSLRRKSKTTASITINQQPKLAQAPVNNNNTSSLANDLLRLRLSSPNSAVAIPANVPQQSSGSPPKQILGHATLKQKEIAQIKKYSSSSNSPPLPSPSSWFRAQAKYAFDGQEIDDLPFQKGDILEVCPTEDSPGWAKAKKVGQNEIGTVPTNYLQPL